MRMEVCICTALVSGIPHLLACMLHVYTCVGVDVWMDVCVCYACVCVAARMSGIAQPLHMSCQDTCVGQHLTVHASHPATRCLACYLAVPAHILRSRQFTGAVDRGGNRRSVLTGLSTRSGDQSCTLLKSKAAALQPGAACLTRSLAQFCSSLK